MNENQSPEVETYDATIDTCNFEELAVVQTYARKPFTVKAVRVTEDNIGTVADWCGGEVHSSRFAKDGKLTNRSFIKVPVQRPMNEKQTQAYIGDWVLQHADKSWKVYIDKAFTAIFMPVVTPKMYLDLQEKQDPSVYGANQLKMEKVVEDGLKIDSPQTMNFLPKRVPGEHMAKELRADQAFTPDNWFGPGEGVTNPEV